MIISPSRKFIFIKSRKTAGSSIQHTMAALCSPDDYIFGAGFKQNTAFLPKGQKSCTPAHQVQSYLDPHIWRDYFKFTFIRNPWDLAVSRYFFELKKKRYPFYDLKKKSYLFFELKKKRCPEMDFQTWLTHTPEKTWEKDELTQYTHINGELAVEFVGRFESLANDINTVFTKLGGKNLVLGHEKKSHISRTHYSTYYDQTAIDFVANKQKRAIDLYNYNFDRA